MCQRKGMWEDEDEEEKEGKDGCGGMSTTVPHLPIIPLIMESFHPSGLSLISLARTWKSTSRYNPASRRAITRAVPRAKATEDDTRQRTYDDAVCQAACRNADYISRCRCSACNLVSARCSSADAPARTARYAGTRTASRGYATGGAGSVPKDLREPLSRF